MRHGDRQALDRYLFDAGGKEILQKDLVLSARKTPFTFSLRKAAFIIAGDNSANHFSGDAVDLGGCINLIDTINTPKFLGGDLAGCGFIPRSALQT